MPEIGTMAVPRSSHRSVGHAVVNVGSLLARHARYRGDHLAVVCGAPRLTLQRALRAVNRLSNALLALGLAKGDKLAIILPNCLELLDAYRACAQLGLVSVPLSPLLRGAAWSRCCAIRTRRR